LGVLEDGTPLEDHAPALSPADEIPKAQLQARRPPLSSLVTDPKDAAGIAGAYLEHRYTQPEIADHLGAHCSTTDRRGCSADGRRLADMVRNSKARLH
jgi:hypothetical protein